MRDDERSNFWNSAVGGTVILLLAVLVSGVLGVAVYLFTYGTPDRGRWNKARTDMSQLTRMLNTHALEHNNAYPANLGAASPAASHRLRIDPFTGRSYDYTRTPTGFRLECLGSDGVVGGADIPEKDIIFTEVGEIK